MNIEALSKWVGHIPEETLEEMAEIAPMLEHFGYDPNENPPNYGKPDGDVVKNMNDIKQNKHKWEEKGEWVRKMSKKDMTGTGDS